MSMPSPTWLQIGVTAEKDLSKGEGCSWAPRLRLEAQPSELSTSSFLRSPLTACCSIGERGKICPLTLQRELWLSYKILWLQFLSQICMIPVSLQRYIFPKICSFWHLWSHLWVGIGPSLFRIVDKKITLLVSTIMELPYTSIMLINGFRTLQLKFPNRILNSAGQGKIDVWEKSVETFALCWLSNTFIITFMQAKARSALLAFLSFS